MKKSTGSQNGEPYSGTNTYVSSGNNSSLKTSAEYDIDESLDIKEEIDHDGKRHQRKNNNLLSERIQLHGKCITTEISFDNNSASKALIKYDYDEILEIKEEIIQDKGNIEQGLNEKYEPKLCTLGTREADIMVAKNPRNSKRKKIQESKSEPKKKHRCDKCARSYVQSQSLYKHKKFECDGIPQFSCEFCGKRFKLKGNVNAHILRMHQKKKSNASPTRHNCDKCSRNYSLLGSLNEHKRLEHAAVKIQFICDICDQKFKRKDYLSQHITSRHFQKIYGPIPEPAKKYKCENCARSYSQKRCFNRHKKFECGVMPQFSCEFCGKLFKRKSYMNTHILRVHQKTVSKISQTRHNCDKCSRSYSSAHALSDHKRLKHATVRPQFICDFCRFQTKRKYYLSRHIASCHSKQIHVLIPQPDKKYNCEKCARSYVQKENLYRHQKFECGGMAQFSCEFCGKKFKQKSHMKRHMDLVHKKTNSRPSQVRRTGEKCSRSYSSADALYQHKRLGHAAINI